MGSTIVIDPALGNSTAIRLRGELERGEWQNADALLGNLQGWDERAFLVGALSEWPGRPGWLDEWYRKRSLSSAVPVLYAVPIRFFGLGRPAARRPATKSPTMHFASFSPGCRRPNAISKKPPSRTWRILRPGLSSSLVAWGGKPEPS